MRYIYSDESTFSEPHPCLGTGLLIVDYAIEQAIVDKALDNLKSDEDRFKEPAKKLDDNTLGRGFFHASEDSKNAHSHLCVEINNIKNADFVSVFLDKNKVEGEKDESYLYGHSAILSSIKGTHTSDNIKLIVEGRQGLSIDNLYRLYSDFYEQNLRDIYDQPFIPFFFPKLDIQIVDKKETGIQVADFLLWAVNRNLNGDSKWLDRIISHTKFGFQTDTGRLGGQVLHLGGGLRDIDAHYVITDFPAESDSAINQEMYIEFYISAARTVETYFKNPLPHISHLLTEAKDVVENKLNTNYHHYFEKVSSSYLKLFDMVPLIKHDTPPSEKTFLLLSKKYMALLLRTDLVNGMMTKIQLEKVRRDIIVNSPARLSF